MASAFGHPADFSDYPPPGRQALRSFCVALCCCSQVREVGMQSAFIEIGENQMMKAAFWNEHQKESENHLRSTDGDNRVKAVRFPSMFREDVPRGSRRWIPLALVLGSIAVVAYADHMVATVPLGY